MTQAPARLADPAAAVAAAGRLRAGLAERAAEHDAAGTLPADDLADLADAGLLGLMVPRRLGGAGAGFADYAAVAIELARGNGATALIYNMHASVTGALAQLPDDLARAMGVPDSYFAARDRILSAAVAGARYAVAMSEPGVGSRLSAMTTSYRADDGGFRIEGHKTFVSGAEGADGYLVAAVSADAPDAAPADAGGTGQADVPGAVPAGARRSEPADAPRTGPTDVPRTGPTDVPRTVSQFLVPAGPGVRVEPTWDSMGMRATASHDVRLSVRVAPDALLGGIEGLAVPVAQVMPQWLVASYAAVYVGVATAVLDAAAAHATERGLGRLPAVRARLGRADAELAATRLAVLEAARRVDAEPGTPETNRWVWRAKLLAGDTAARLAADLLEAAGASATRRGHPLERLYRDARCGAVQPATSDVCADWLGVAALGGDPNADAAVPRW